jgi:CRP-like cAMP-binding protein
MILIIMPKNIDLPDPFDALPAGAVKRRRFRQNQLVFHQGSLPDALYFVRAGNVMLLRHSEAGQPVVLHRANAGEFIAEASLFSSMYHCDCVAISDADLVAIRKSAVLDLMARDANFAAALVQRLAGQVQGYRRQLELRSIRSAPDRVLAGVADGWLNASVMQFSSDMGLTHEATYRSLAGLVRAGKLCKTGRGKYEIAEQGT